jgi:uncharacterized membrane protein YhfC
MMLLWLAILLASHSLLSKRFGERLATIGIGTVAFFSLVTVGLTYLALNNSLDGIQTYSNNPPVAVYGFAAFFNSLALAAVSFASTIGLTLGAATVLEIYRRLHKN